MNTIIYPSEQIIVSEKGVFKLSIIQTTDRNSGIVVPYSIHLGGKNRKCFSIRFPSHQSDDTSGYISWVESHEECSFERFTEKGLGQHIMSLGITITRNINPKLKTIKLEDSSNFPCKLPNGTERKVPMKLFHLAFHQSTWYEYYFDAKLEKNHDEYLQLKQNFSNPDIKPDTFDFINEELQRELMPIYLQTTTWKDFFDSIAKYYGRKKCSVIYPWIHKALYIIFEKYSYFENVNWIIDLDENKSKNKTSSVYYESYKASTRGGGKHKSTRKHREQSWEQVYLMPNIPEISQWKYTQFLHGNKQTV